MFVGAGWPHTAGKYGGTFTSEPMSQERGSYLRNLSQGVASTAFWFKKKKITIGQKGTEKVQNEKRPLDSQNSVSEKQTVTFQGKGRKTQN